MAVKKFGVPVFNLRFDVWKLGPVSKDLFVELSDEPNLLSEYISKERVENDRFVICAKREFSDNEFSDNEMELLEQVAERFKYCTAKELINFTHRKNSPWYNAAQKNGLVDAFEDGKITTTDIEIDLSEEIKDEEQKLSLYQSHQEFLAHSRNLRLRPVFTPGRLFFFDPFYFKRGNSSPKFFLVIKVIDEKVVLASLPPSQVHLPASQSIVHGCLEIPDSGINCYIFEAKRPVTTSGWCFDYNTF